MSVYCSPCLFSGLGLLDAPPPNLPLKGGGIRPVLYGSLSSSPSMDREHALRAFMICKMATRNKRVIPAQAGMTPDFKALDAMISGGLGNDNHLGFFMGGRH